MTVTDWRNQRAAREALDLWAGADAYHGAIGIVLDRLGLSPREAEVDEKDPDLADAIRGLEQLHDILQPPAGSVESVGEDSSIVEGDEVVGAFVRKHAHHEPRDACERQQQVYFHATPIPSSGGGWMLECAWCNESLRVSRADEAGVLKCPRCGWIGNEADTVWQEVTHGREQACPKCDARVLLRRDA